MFKHRYDNGWCFVVSALASAVFAGLGADAWSSPSHASGWYVGMSVFFGFTAIAYLLPDKE